MTKSKWLSYSMAHLPYYCLLNFLLFDTEFQVCENKFYKQLSLTKTLAVLSFSPGDNYQARGFSYIFPCTFSVIRLADFAYSMNTLLVFEKIIQKLSGTLCIKGM